MNSDEQQLRVEITALKAENLILRGRSVEDAHDAEERLELAVHLAKGTDVEALEQQIAELRRLLVAEDAMVDRVCVFIRRRNEGGIR